MARTFEEIDATGYYENDEERAIYLSTLLSRGVPIDPAAQAWLDEYYARQTAAAPSSAYASSSSQPAATSGAQAASTTSSTNLLVDPGQYKQIIDEQNALQKYINDLQSSTQKEIAQLNASTQTALAAKDRQLQLDLLNKRITSDQYMQQRELAQRESEFARTIALQTLIADRDYEINQATLRLNELAEYRAERELSARLAANPADFVAYEFFKRASGTPQAWSAAQNFAAAEGQGEGITPQTLLGEDYPEAPPAYDDETLQQVASGIFNQDTGAYNPRLSGIGVFGANIPGPQTISRAEGLQLTDAEMGILSSFLRAGVDVGGGKRVALDPGEYFQQVEQSWIPTLTTAGATTNYR